MADAEVRPHVSVSGMNPSGIRASWAYGAHAPGLHSAAAAVWPCIVYPAQRMMQGSSLSFATSPRHVCAEFAKHAAAGASAPGERLCSVQMPDADGGAALAADDSLETVAKLTRTNRYRQALDPDPVPKPAPNADHP